MLRIGIISCASEKKQVATKARDLYISNLFQKSRQYVEENCDIWFILSAKYGLVDPNEIIEPYDESLKNMSRPERYEWVDKVWAELQSKIEPNDIVTILAGEAYREKLVNYIKAYGCYVNIPLQGLGIGKQLKWLSDNSRKPNRCRDIERFYKILQNLEEGISGKRLMNEATGRQKWPISGVYLFFEPDELRLHNDEPRVVRVGTHRVSSGAKSTLWDRLRTHRGTGKGGGNHRSSIFRLHVGAAIANKYPNMKIATWGIGQAANKEVRKTEEELEKRVSEHIGSMSFLWIAVEDEASPASDRAYIERNLIGLLVGTRGPTDPPSSKWLGRFSPDERIRFSGLWNLTHLDYNYSPNFLDVLNEYVLITIGRKSKPAGPIAPREWHANEKKGIHHNQLLLCED